MNKITSFFTASGRAVRSVFCSVLLLTLLGVGVSLTACSSTPPSAIEEKQETSPPQTEPAVSDKTAQTTPAASDTSPQFSSAVSDAAAQTEPATTASSGISGQIDLDSARQAALADAGLTDSEVTQTKGELDYEDLNPVYEIEFFTATHDYEYEIDAVSGEIRHREQERHHAAEQGHHSYGGASPSPSSEGSVIGPEAAKTIAADHAGVSASDAVFTKTEEDFEDGRLIYEIEFWNGRTEYEYEIDALSGEIIKFDSDRDD